jgi:hypothetical protein
MSNITQLVPGSIPSEPFHTTPQQQDKLSFVIFISALFGLLGAFSTVIAYLLSHKFRSSVIAKVVLGIAIGDILSVLAQGYGDYGNQAGHLSLVCQTQAFFQQLGELASIFLIASIAVSLLLVMYADISFEKIRQFEVWYIVCAFALALVLAAVPLGIKDHSGLPIYGPGPLWCWFSRAAKDFYWMLYVPVIAVLLLNACTLILVRFYLQKRDEENALFQGINVDDPLVDQLPRLVSMYVIITLVIWVPIVITQVYRTFHPESSVSMVMAVCLPLRGLVDFGVAYYQAWYGTTQKHVERAAQMAFK